MGASRVVQSWRVWAGVLLAAGVGTLLLARRLAVASPGTDLRHPAVLLTARVAVWDWFLAVGGMLLLRPADWEEHTGRLRLVRWAWALGVLMHLVHVVCAFGLAHGWSHDAAVRHVAEVGGSGVGIVVNYLFAAVWLADAVWWCATPAGYARRPRWVGRTVHGLLAFVTLNATVVFGSAGTRVVDGVVFGVIAVMLVRASWRVRPPKE